MLPGSLGDPRLYTHTHTHTHTILRYRLPGFVTCGLGWGGGREGVVVGGDELSGGGRGGEERSSVLELT